MARDLSGPRNHPVLRIGSGTTNVQMAIYPVTTGNYVPIATIWKTISAASKTNADIARDYAQCEMDDE